MQKQRQSLHSSFSMAAAALFTVICWILLLNNSAPRTSPTRAHPEECRHPPSYRHWPCEPTDYARIVTPDASSGEGQARQYGACSATYLVGSTYVIKMPGSFMQQAMVHNISRWGSFMSGNRVPRLSGEGPLQA